MRNCPFGLMSHTTLGAVVLLTSVLRTPLSAQQPGSTEYVKGRVSLLVMLGTRDKKPAEWNGSVTVKPGTIASIERRAFQTTDLIDGDRWELSSYEYVPRIKWMKRRRAHATPNGIVVTFDGTDDTSVASFETAQGNFTLKPHELPYGKEESLLKGRVKARRVPASSMVVSAPTEDDYPSAALAKKGQICVAYVAFTHGEGFEKALAIPEEPKDFSHLGKPTGGDQVMLTVLDGGRWPKPEPVTAGGEDIYKTALAVDGEGRIWVFWSRNVDGNWDLFARTRHNAEWSDEMRITNAPGPDINPVATTDASGHVWLAWQSCRTGNFDIMVARQNGDRLGKEIAVDDSPANQWDPAMAASVNGEVAVAWDSYARGDYDVYCRLWRTGEWADPLPIAASNRYEARAAVAFDRRNCLWIAWEEAREGWGKDWGRVERVGSPLYGGRGVNVAVLGGGTLHRPAPDTKTPFKGAAMPCLGTDSSGRVWLGFRKKVGGLWPRVGSVWAEYVTTCAGKRWMPQTVVPHTDGLLDNHPVMLPAPDSGLMLIGSSDMRRRSVLVSGRKKQKIRMPLGPPTWPDPVNFELFMADFGLPATPGPEPVLAELPLQAPAPVSEATQSERADVKRMREYRAKIGGESLRILRGEFHRHTEISWDGGGDGALLDMFRYGLDAAGMDWIGNGDHDWGNGREYPWWTVQKVTDAYHVPGAFTTMFSYERSCGYPDGHRNPLFAKRGVRSLARLRGGRGKAMDKEPNAPRPHSPDTVMLYKYLRAFDGITAVHTSATNHGTDWRDNDPKVEPVVEVYQGCRLSSEKEGGPRTFSADGDERAGFRPLGFVSHALMKGYRLAFQASSDHGSTHISYCNLWAPEPTREAVFQSFRKRRLYGATDNILADVRCNGHFMGDEFETDKKPTLTVKLVGTAPFANVKVVRDNEYVYSIEPGKADVDFIWTDAEPKTSGTSYYYVRGLQEDEEVVWVTPFWVAYRPQ